MSEKLLVVYPAIADKYLAPLASRLRGVNPPSHPLSKSVCNLSLTPVGLRQGILPPFNITVINRRPVLARLRLWPWRHPKKQDLAQRPDMVRQAGRHRRCPRLAHLGRARPAGWNRLG